MENLFLAKYSYERLCSSKNALISELISSKIFNITSERFPDKKLNNIGKFIPNKMFNTIKLFLLKYWLFIKRNIMPTVTNIKFLHYHISQQTV